MFHKVFQGLIFLKMSFNYRNIWTVSLTFILRSPTFPVTLRLLCAIVIVIELFLLFKL